MLHLEHSFLCCRNLDTSENTSELRWKSWNVVLEKNEGHSDWSMRNEVLYRVKEERNNLSRIKWRKATWIVDTLRRKCFENTLLSERWKGREDAQKDEGRYYMALQEREDTGISKTTLDGSKSVKKPRFKEATDLTQDRLRSGWQESSYYRHDNTGEFMTPTGASERCLENISDYGCTQSILQKKIPWYFQKAYVIIHILQRWLICLIASNQQSNKKGKQ